jgi:hypothetical protein
MNDGTYDDAVSKEKYQEDLQDLYKKYREIVDKNETVEEKLDYLMRYFIGEIVQLKLGKKDKTDSEKLLEALQKPINIFTNK